MPQPLSLMLIAFEVVAAEGEKFATMSLADDEVEARAAKEEIDAIREWLLKERELHQMLVRASKSAAPAIPSML